MSDFTESEEFDEVDEGPAGLRQHNKRLEAQARQAEEKANALERELAFAKAGLDLNDPKMGYFVKGYDGEADPEKIRAAAEAAGFIGNVVVEPQVPETELAEHQAAANLAAGGSLEPPDSNAEYQAALANARSKEEALAIMDKFGSLRTSNIL